MPTLLYTRAQGHVHGASIDFQQRLLLCLVVVISAILCAFGTAKLIEHVTRGSISVAAVVERRPPSVVDPSARSKPNLRKSAAATHHARTRVQQEYVHDLRRCSSFSDFAHRRPLSLAFKPSPPREYTGPYPAAMTPTFLRASPTMHHITAQRLYASRHPHRSKKKENLPPGVACSLSRPPSPLREVLCSAEQLAEFESVDVTEAAPTASVEVGTRKTKKTHAPSASTKIHNALLKLGLASLPLGLRQNNDSPATPAYVPKSDFVAKTKKGKNRASASSTRSSVGTAKDKENVVLVEANVRDAMLV